MSDQYETRADLPIIHRPDAEDLKLAQETGEVCGACAHFELAEGQALMRATQFVEVLVKEHKWKEHYLCSPTNQLGICGQYMSGSGSSATVTGVLHKACDAFRRNRGLISISRKTTDYGRK